MTEYVHKATLTVKKSGTISYKKLLGAPRGHERSTIAVKEAKGILTIEIRARDLASLRASINGITRELQVIEGTAV